MYSYTKINTYKTCPKQYEYKYVQRRTPLPTQKMLEGATEHLKIAESEEVPDFFKKAFLKNFSQPVFERELTIKLAEDVELFGKIDCFSLEKFFCSIAEWKLWQLTEDDSQLKFYALLIANAFPNIAYFNGFQVSVKGEFFKRYFYDAETLQAYEEELLKIIEELKEDKDFLPRPGPHCNRCSFVRNCYEENKLALEVIQINTLEEAMEIAKKVYIAESFLDQVKTRLKEFLMENGLDELVFDEVQGNRVYLSPSIALRWGKTSKKKNK